MAIAMTGVTTIAAAIIVTGAGTAVASDRRYDRYHGRRAGWNNHGRNCRTEWRNHRRIEICR